MPSLKDLRSRIASVTSTRKITKAMQMVAAAKLRRAQEAAQNARPYAQRMKQVLASLASGVAQQEGAPELLAGTGKEESVLLVVATADRGLCGGFNSSIVRKGRERLVALRAEGKQVKLLLIGRKGLDQLKRLYSDDIIAYIETKESGLTGTVLVEKVALEITSRSEKGEFDIVELVYAQFESIMSQEPVSQKLIPAKDALSERTEEETESQMSGNHNAIYEYEPSEEAILETLLPRYLSTQILRAILENAAGEQGARMTAMDNATRNAGEMIDDLSLQYNRARQAQITKELIEIISGAEAL